MLGRKAELVVEDDATTNPDAVLAFSRLAGRSDVTALIGSIRSTQMHAIAPDVLKTGKPTMIGGTDPARIFPSNAVLVAYGPSPEVLPGLFDKPGFEFGGMFMDTQYIAIAAAALAPLQYEIFEKTSRGKKLQAISQDREMAGLFGIPVVLITFAYSAALGGLAGILVAPVLLVSVGMGALISLKVFAANITGAILGGLALGVVEIFGAAFIAILYKIALAFTPLLFLLVRPTGVVRREERREGMSTTVLPAPSLSVYRLGVVPALLFAVLGVIATSTLVPQQGYTLNIVM